MTIPEYILEQDEAVQPRLIAIYDTIRKAIPDTEERLSWGMPTFWKRPEHHSLCYSKKAYRPVSGAGGSRSLCEPAERLQNQ